MRGRAHAAALIALAILTLIAGHRLAFSDWIMARGDTYSYHYPYWQTRAAVARGETSGVWTDMLFGGVPLAANPQYAGLYPLNAALIELNAPDAIRVSALLHLWLAGVGAYALARGALGVGWLAGVVGGGAFLLGGHLGAHVEQINQLQGLAWMPWALWAFDRALKQFSPRKRKPTDPIAPDNAGVVPTARARFITRAVRLSLWTYALACIMALQFLSGHTQTVFLTGAALGVYALVMRPVRGVVVLAIAAALALVAALPQIPLFQLWQTLKLAELGNRQDGFTLQQATAFSLSPFAVGRGLLPSFDRMIFSEYIAYLGIGVTALAWVGTFTRRGARPWLVIAVIGVVLAFGIYNPLYALVYNLPGFSLFRVPARWLALFAIGGAMLAAIGVESLRARPIRLLPLIGFLGTVVGLIALTPLITRTIDGTPAYPAETGTWIGWFAAAVIAVIALALTRIPRAARFATPILIASAGIELLLASGAMAYNLVIPPDAFSAERFSISQLQAYIERDSADPNRSNRLLSMSDLLFDPGDRAALEARFDALGITGEARALAFDTVKLREVVGGNLPLLWGIPSFDGFDGGLLPTRAYSTYTSLMLPPGEMRTLDGRLRESLYADSCGGACIPDRRWLDLAGVRYLLTDKVYDLVRAGVFYDTTFPVTTPTRYANSSGFTAEAVDLLYACASASCDPPGIDAGGSASAPEALDRYTHVRYTLDAPTALESVTVTPPPGVTVRAVSLVADPAANSPLFAQLTPDPYVRLLSSDIKLYENTAVLPRAFLVTRARCVGDDAFGDEFALTIMRSPGFDPAWEAVIAAPSSVCARLTGGEPGTVEMTYSEAGALNMRVTTDAPALLIINTAHYPAWRAMYATGHTSPVSIPHLYRADLMFMAIPIEPGSHQIYVRMEWIP